MVVQPGSECTISLAVQRPGQFPMVIEGGESFRVLSIVCRREEQLAAPCPAAMLSPLAFARSGHARFPGALPGAFVLVKLSNVTSAPAKIAMVLDVPAEVIARERERDMMRRPATWAQRPLLPIKRRAPMGPRAPIGIECATLVEGQGWRVYLTGILGPGAWSDAETKTYDTLEALVADGWRID